MILSLIDTDALKGQYVQRILHNTDQRPVPLRALTDLTALAAGRSNIETLLAECDPGLNILSAPASWREISSGARNR